MPEHCRLCHSPHLRSRFSAKGHVIVRCRDCGLTQVAHPPAPEELDAIYQQSYFSHHKYQDTATLARETRRRLALVQRHLAGGRMLEVGCATGDFMAEAKAHYELYGFDLSAYAVEVAQQKNPDIAARIWTGRLEDQHLSPQFFDAICAWDVIEHIWDPLPTFGPLMDYLKPGGYLLLSTPNAGAFTARVMGRYWAFMTPPEHLTLFDRRSLSTLAAKLNARVVHWESKGKWANAGFLVYKLKRTMPFLVPGWLVNLFERPALARWSVYVPTGDVQYAVLQKGNG